jgi:hypothetical protein
MGISWILLVSIIAKLSSAMERHYFIAAEEVAWNYAPSGRNLASVDNEYV